MFDPTPEQIEAAARALFLEQTGEGEEHGGKVFDSLSSNTRLKKRYFDQARTVLVAAAGAAPQPGGEKPGSDRVDLANLLQEIHDPLVTEGGCNFSTWGYNYMGGNGEVTEVVDTILAAGFTRSKPVQVDEAKLVEITRSTIDRRTYSDDIRREIKGLEHAVAREIAARSVEWLRGGAQ